MSHRTPSIDSTLDSDDEYTLTAFGDISVSNACFVPSLPTTLSPSSSPAPSLRKPRKVSPRAQLRVRKKQKNITSNAAWLFVDPSQIRTSIQSAPPSTPTPARRIKPKSNNKNSMPPPPPPDFETLVQTLRDLSVARENHAPIDAPPKLDAAPHTPVFTKPPSSPESVETNKAPAARGNVKPFRGGAKMPSRLPLPKWDRALLDEIA